MPVEPPPTPWGFPDREGRGRARRRRPGRRPRAGHPARAPTGSGLFPMPARPRRPDGAGGRPTRGASCPLDGLRVSRSLRRSCRRYEVRVDTAFAEVVDGVRRPQAGRAVGSTPRSGPPTASSTSSGWAHSVEAWDDDGLAGGLYGVAIGGLFAGESMFHRRARRVEGGARRPGGAAAGRRASRPAARRAVAGPTTSRRSARSTCPEPRTSSDSHAARSLPLPAIWA